MIIKSHQDYIYDISMDWDDPLAQMLAAMPKAERRMHRMDGGKYMSFADSNLLVLLHKLGLRGKQRASY